jgi:hypothetical protein
MLATRIFRLKLRAVTFLSLLLVFTPAVLMGAQVQAADTIQDNLCAGANLNINSSCKSGGITDQQAADRINNIIRLVINIFSILVGVVAVIMIIIGGLKYITSGGDSSNVTGAKNTILYAVVGLVVVAMAQFIVRFVLTKVNSTGTSGGTL